MQSTVINRKPANRFRNVVEQRLLLRRQGTLDNLLQNKKLNLSNVITVKNFAWFLTWLICFIGSFFQSIGVVQSFLKSETTTSIEYVPTSDLPAVTICFDKSDLINTDNETIRRTINQMDISQQLNFTHSYTQLFASCMVVTLNDSVPCHELLTVTHFVTFDFKCISIHEPKIDNYLKNIKPRLLLNHTHIYTFALNKSLGVSRFDLTIHNLTNPLQILDQNWVKLTPNKYSSAKISFKHIQMSLLPAPYDTNCSYYKGFSTKANCLNLCFVEEYYWKEDYKWPPYVPGFNKKKKTLTDKFYIESNSTNSTEGENERTKRQVSLNDSGPFGILADTTMLGVTTMRQAATSDRTTTTAATAATAATTEGNTSATEKPPSIGTRMNFMLNLNLNALTMNTTNATQPKKKSSSKLSKAQQLAKILAAAKNKKKNAFTGFFNKVIKGGVKLQFKEEFELNTKKMSEAKLSIKGIPDIRGYCDWRCDRGQECHEDIYKPVRETEIEAKSEENAEEYTVEIQPSKYVFSCLTLEKYKRIHLACFLASTITLWFGGSIFFLVRYLIKGNLHTIRCLFCCNRKSNRD